MVSDKKTKEKRPILFISNNQVLDLRIIIAKWQIYARHPWSTTIRSVRGVLPKATFLTINRTVFIVHHTGVISTRQFTKMLGGQFDFNVLAHINEHVLDAARCLHIYFYKSKKKIKPPPDIQTVY